MQDKQINKLINVRKNRFNKNARHHMGIDWAEVAAKLAVKSEKLSVLFEMERTGGEPDVIGCDDVTGEFLFCDRRYNQVFVYHNGAESYYAARGFRGLLRV